MTPRVAVIVPSYNKAPFLEETLESLLAQTMDDFECVVVDDASTDESLALAERIAQRDPRVTVRTNPGNAHLGVGATMRVAVEYTTAPFFAPLDADDLWAPNRLEKTLQHIGDAGMVYTKARVIDEGGTPTGEVIGRPPSDGDVFRQLLHSNLVPTLTVLMRRDAYDAAGGYFNESVWVDLNLWLRIAATSTLTFLDEALADYRLTSSSHDLLIRATVGRFAGLSRTIGSAAAWPGMPPAQARMGRSYAGAWDALHALATGEPTKIFVDDDVDALLSLVDERAPFIATLVRKPRSLRSLDVLDNITPASRQRIHEHFRRDRRLRRPGPRTYARRLMHRLTDA
jgi:hypothetical protein